MPWLIHLLIIQFKFIKPTYLPLLKQVPTTLVAKIPDAGGALQLTIYQQEWMQNEEAFCTSIIPFTRPKVQVDIFPAQQMLIWKVSSCNFIRTWMAHFKYTIILLIMFISSTKIWTYQEQFCIQPTTSIYIIPKTWSIHICELHTHFNRKLCRWRNRSSDKTNVLSYSRSDQARSE